MYPQWLSYGRRENCRNIKNQNHQNNEIIYPFVDEQVINNINFIKITDKIRKIQ